MSEYSDLINDLTAKRTNVALFRKVALHSHSPDSHDYRGKDRSEYPHVLKDLNLNMLAITDHMKCGLACQIAQSNSLSNLCVLPGMEVSFRPDPPWNEFRLHLIAIFPETYSVDRISKILPGSMVGEDDRTGLEEISGTDLKSFVKQVHDCGGLCSAAHVDRNRGVRRAFRQLGRDAITLYTPGAEPTEEEEARVSEAFKDWVFDAEVDALEVISPDDKTHYRWISKVHERTLSIPALLTSDAHSLDELRTSRKVTFIKMTDVSFKGLEQALRFPDTRVRFPVELPEVPSPRILGMEIQSGGEEGFFKHLRVAFSDNLNCLIGPRGSGKSAIIEALRFAFGYNRTLNQIEDTGADLANKARSLQEATLSNCVIRVIYCLENGERNILEATYDPKQDYSTRVYTEDNEDKQVADVEASGEYPLRLFGWSEIETLGREPHRQRDLLDRLVPDLGERLEERRRTRGLLTQKRREIRSSLERLGEILSQDRGEIRRYKEYKTDFDRLNTDEARQLFAGLDFARLEQAVLEKVKSNAESWAKSLQISGTGNLLEGVPDLMKGAPEDLVAWWNEKKKERDLTGRESEVSGQASKAVNLLEDLATELGEDIQGISKKIQENDRAIRQKVSEEASKQVAVELRRSAGERLRRVEGIRREYNTEWDNLERLLKEWSQIARRVTSLQDEISGKRARRKEEIETRLNEFCTEEIRVAISFSSGGDRSEFEDHLREENLLSRHLHGNYKAAQWPEKIAAVVTPTEFVEAILLNDPSRLIREVEMVSGTSLGIDERMAQCLTETLYPFGDDEDADVKTVDLEKLDRLLQAGEVLWDDQEGVLLNDRFVERLSPGQRSSAMLPLIALTEKTPLVIDQPEDNLDNKLVGKMLVDILADLKEKRQIIVATHNPNIVVLGDAEQVIVLDALSDSEGKCKQAGSIDIDEIVGSVVDNMEGGKEAFVTRYRKYGIE